MCLLFSRNNHINFLANPISPAPNKIPVELSQCLFNNHFIDKRRDGSKCTMKPPWQGAKEALDFLGILPHVQRNPYIIPVRLRTPEPTHLTSTLGVPKL